MVTLHWVTVTCLWMSSTIVFDHNLSMIGFLNSKLVQISPEIVTESISLAPTYLHFLSLSVSHPLTHSLKPSLTHYFISHISSFFLYPFSYSLIHSFLPQTPPSVIHFILPHYLSHTDNRSHCFSKSATPCHSFILSLSFFLVLLRYLNISITVYTFKYFNFYLPNSVSLFQYTYSVYLSIHIILFLIIRLQSLTLPQPFFQAVFYF